MMCTCTRTRAGLSHRQPQPALEHARPGPRGRQCDVENPFRHRGGGWKLKCGLLRPVVAVQPSARAIDQIECGPVRVGASRYRPSQAQPASAPDRRPATPPAPPRPARAIAVGTDLLVGKDEHRHAGELVIVHELPQLLVRLLKSLAVCAVNHVDLTPHGSTETAHHAMSRHHPTNSAHARTPTHAPAAGKFAIRHR